MLYWVGKHSSVMLHLARKTFYPATPPVPSLHVDTTWKFSAMYQMRDRAAADAGMDLIVHHNEELREMQLTIFSERPGRATDRNRADSMEKKKREGYF